MKSIIKLIVFVLPLTLMILGCKSMRQALEAGLKGTLPSSMQKVKDDLPDHYEADFGGRSRLPTHIAFVPDSKVDAQSFPAWIKKELKVDVHQIGKEQRVDDVVHTSYRQYHEGMPVFGSQYIFHDDALGASCSGLVYSDIPSFGSPKLTHLEVIAQLTESHPGYSFESNGLPIILPIEQDSLRQYYMTYDIAALDTTNGDMSIIFGDAMTGEIRLSTPAAVFVTGPGEGITTDGKVVQFGTQYVDEYTRSGSALEVSTYLDGYRLRDTIRNLHTLSMNNRTRTKVYVSRSDEDDRYYGVYYEVPGDEIIEPDNNWENSPHAVDAHWGMARSYDYFMSEHNRMGHDGQNGYLRAYVNYFVNYKNAFYVTPQHGDFMMFGDGPDVHSPFTVLDIVAHEYAHAVCQHIVDLRYHGESGSIDEGIADIFSTAISFRYGDANWVVGDKAIPGGIRNMKDPKALQHPDTYTGEYWREYRTPFAIKLGLENEPRHHNASILTHWFYLLSEGGKGENDNKDGYDIEAIGMKKAERLMYKSLYYMPPSVDYRQLRKITKRLAEKEYGRCSPELKAVTNAWNAVGVGDPFCDCFSGSVKLEVQSKKETGVVKYYLKNGKTAVEVQDKDGRTHIVNTTPSDPYRHLQGHQDIQPSILKNMFQAKGLALIQEEYIYPDRKSYVKRRNSHRTGRKMQVSGYTAYEYIIDGYEMWSTEEACVALVDLFTLFAYVNHGAKANNFKSLFGLPVKMTDGKTGFQITEIREYDVPDTYFQR